MKKLLAIFAFLGVLAFNSSFTYAQADAAAPDSVSAQPTSEVADVTEVASDEAALVEDEKTFHQQVKEYFIQGGPPFMWPILFSLVLGLAISIERIITLNMATTNTKKLLTSIEDALAKGGVEAAKDVAKNTRGPIASIFTQGLMRHHEGIEMVEKSIVSYGGVEMGRLERGLIWVSLFISLGPMLGFFGTVIGMIFAFDAIEAAGDISPQVVAGGMKVALITTVAGLITGMILQICYNYLVSKIDGIVNEMEDASISLIDILVKHKLSK